MGMERIELGTLFLRDAGKPDHHLAGCGHLAPVDLAVRLHRRARLPAFPQSNSTSFKRTMDVVLGVLLCSARVASRSGQALTRAMPLIRKNTSRLGNRNSIPTRSSCSRLRIDSMRLLPGQWAKATVYGSSTRTQPGGPLRGEASRPLPWPWPGKRRWQPSGTPRARRPSGRARLSRYARPAARTERRDRRSRARPGMLPEWTWCLRPVMTLKALKHRHRWRLYISHAIEE